MLNWNFRKTVNFLLLPAYFFVMLSAAFGQGIARLEISNLPEIQKLSSTDVVFKQFEETVTWNDKILADVTKNDDFIEEFYSYTISGYEDLLTVSAAANLPYDTIASLNSIPDSKSKIAGKKIVLPAVKGIFVAENPVNSVEILVQKEFQSFVDNSKIPCYIISNRKFFFLPGKRFTSTQRAFFLDTTIRMPLDKIQVSSAFGYRNSPVYNRWKFHKGVDFAAAEGTQVYACKSGTVAYAVKNDPTFGNYVILSHANSMTSVYAHLSKMCVAKGNTVHSGDVIGYVGQTGAATGPHLHFEIRQNGVATDPGDLLKY